MTIGKDVEEHCFNNDLRNSLSHSSVLKFLFFLCVGFSFSVEVLAGIKADLLRNYGSSRIVF